MTNKTALLIGGSRGIGAATFDLLTDAGWSVLAPTRAFLDMRYASHVEENMPAVIESATKMFGVAHLDALIFTHGEWFSRPLAAQNGRDYIVQYQSRVASVVGVICHCLPLLAGGCVVVVSSTRGLIGGVDTGPYSLACAAQIAMVQGFAREHTGVRFNCIAPGLTDTDLGANVVLTGGAKPGAAMQPPGVVAGEIVRLIESGDNGRVMRVVNSEVSEARWRWTW